MKGGKKRKRMAEIMDRLEQLRSPGKEWGYTIGPEQLREIKRLEKEAMSLLRSNESTHLESHMRNLVAEANARMGGEEWGAGSGVDRMIRALAKIRLEVSNAKGMLEQHKKGGEIDWQDVSDTLQRAHTVFGQAADAAQVAANKQSTRSPKKAGRRLKRK